MALQKNKKNKKIRAVNTKKTKDGDLVTVPAEQSSEPIEEYSFSFRDFQFDQTIAKKDFNNCYETKVDSDVAARELFESLRNICSFSKREVDTNRGLKDQLHANPLTKQDAIDKINIFLKYFGFSDDKIRQYEGCFFEFAFGTQGRRIICHKVGSILLPLFLDPNHLVCENPEKKPGKKRSFTMPFLTDADPSLRKIKDPSEKIDTILAAYDERDNSLDVETIIGILRS